MCNWILRVEAEHRKCNRAGVRLPGAKEAETVGCDKEGAYRSAGKRMHAILHNESILGGHQERVENCRDPEERRDELACTKTLQEIPRQEGSGGRRHSSGEPGELNPSRLTGPCKRQSITTRRIIDDSKVEARRVKMYNKTQAQKVSQNSAVPFGWRKVKYRERHPRSLTSQNNPADQGPSERMIGERMIGS